MKLIKTTLLNCLLLSSILIAGCSPGNATVIDSSTIESQIESQDTMSKDFSTESPIDTTITNDRESTSLLNSKANTNKKDKNRNGIKSHTPNLSAMIKALSDVSNLSEEDIKSKIDNGDTIKEIVEQEDLQDEFRAKLKESSNKTSKERLDKLLIDGKITKEKYNELIKKQNT